MKNKIPAYIVLFALPAAILLVASCQNGFIGQQAGNQGTEGIQFERKIYNSSTIDDDFDGSRVIVIMDKNTGGPNKRHEKSFFGGIEIEAIKDLTELAGDIHAMGINWDIWRQILCLQLPGNSKENVLNVIHQLERIDGIKYAGPNHYLQPFATIPNEDA
ncbi:MAG: hypothetical protein FWD36_08200 [Treponema sp.]|nr:hypothetical protein [Treponema sp.]